MTNKSTMLLEHNLKQSLAVRESKEVVISYPQRPARSHAS